MAKLRQILQNGLKSVRVSDIPLAREKVITLDSKTAVADGFKILVDNKILSAPVWEEDSQSYVGFLDVRDLAKFAVFGSDTQNTTSTFHEVVQHGIKAIPKAIDQVNLKYLAQTHKFEPVRATEGVTLWDAALRLSRPGVHRVPVLDAEGKKVVNVISQSTIVNYLVQFQQSADQNELKDDSPPVSSLANDAGDALVHTPVFAVRGSDDALSMLALMERRNVSGVVVVNNEGAAVSQASSSDLKLWLQTGHSLRVSVLDFLAAVRQSVVTTKDMYPVVHISPNSTLQHCIGSLAATKLHRMFVLNSDGCPVGVIALSDVLKYLCH